MRIPRPRPAVLLALGAVAALVLALFLTGRLPVRLDPGPAPARRLFWFVPDGFRADPEVFDVFRWAREGRLPAFRRMMEKGTYGYCRPTFPGHTPTNFATLFTGAYPEVHGVNDGPMRIEGRPLESAAVGGFSSAAKLVEPAWVTLERELRTDPIVLCIPGSTPPELERGETIRGRWGNWGPDFHPVVFQDAAGLPPERLRGPGSRLFFFGPELTRHVEKRRTSEGAGAPDSFSPPFEARLEAWGAALAATIRDGADDGLVSYDRIAFTIEGGEGEAVVLEAGGWSDWLPARLSWTPPGSAAPLPVDSSLRIKVVRLEADGRFRVLVLFDQLDRRAVDPPELAEELSRAAGPMVDFPDSFPPQLVHVPEDRATFLEVSEMSLEWHRRATASLLDGHRPRVFISDTYAPNQLLSGRWWLGAVDPASARHRQAPQAERDAAWAEIHRIYSGVDAILGEILDRAGDDTLVVFSSDHGMVPLDRRVRLNNLFAREGWLRFLRDPATGDVRIDWAATKVVYLQMCHVYIHPGGLGGSWTRASGPEYESLRRRVGEAILSLEDSSGIAPAQRVVEWERAGAELRLYEPRAGDLVVANRPGFGWSEEITPDLEVFADSLEAGYKQAILSEKVPGMWTPFLIAGPGVHRGRYLGDDPIEMADQLPTVLRRMGVDARPFVQGKLVREALVEYP